MLSLASHNITSATTTTTTRINNNHEAHTDHGRIHRRIFRVDVLPLYGHVLVKFFGDVYTQTQPQSHMHYPHIFTWAAGTLERRQRIEYTIVYTLYISVYISSTVQTRFRSRRSVGWSVYVSALISHIINARLLVGFYFDVTIIRCVCVCACGFVRCVSIKIWPFSHPYKSHAMVANTQFLMSIISVNNYNNFNACGRRRLLTSWICVNSEKLVLVAFYVDVVVRCCLVFFVFTGCSESIGRTNRPVFLLRGRSCFTSHLEKVRHVKGDVN